MDLCIAITRGGFGVPWQFETLLDALTHPLIQHGDAVLSGPDAIPDEYSHLEFTKLLGVVQKPELTERFLARVADLTTRGTTPRLLAEVLRKEDFCLGLWDGLVQRAKVPPDDPAEILQLVRTDREWDLQNRRSGMAKEKKEAAEKVVKEKKEAAPKLVGGLALTTKLDFGTGPQTTKDKEGKETTADAQYHPEKHNPKRGGAAERFKLYKKGITIEAAIAAGMTSGNVAHDLEKKYVVPLAK